jgi:exodeoxyribonuclease VII large subunit
LREQAQRLDDLEQRLQRAQRSLLRDRRGQLLLLASRVRARSPAARVTSLQEQVARLEQRQQRGMRSRLQGAATRLAHLAQLLDSVSPLATLNRGYSIITDDEGQVIRDVGQVLPGDLLNARLARGRLRLEVK